MPQRRPGPSRQCFRFYQKSGNWYPLIWLSMPDHLHAVISVSLDKDITKLLASWKRHTATHQHIDWQEGFFDHRLRQDESANEKIAYIANNPVRANLVAHPDGWPYRLFGYELKPTPTPGREASPRPPQNAAPTPNATSAKSVPLPSVSSPANGTPTGGLGEASLPGAAAPTSLTTHPSISR
ncbi:hypothetical protein Ga0100231_004725 [Opitutaceae bacterium TAV4]|nr:hypothetical protein Ga0100231_004725 [Opitutaceae bacterium TAV4]